MAESKKSKKSGILTRLTPGSVDVNINGREIRVANNKQENTILNAVVISQGRDLIQRSLKRYEDQDVVPDARELVSIIKSMRDLVEASNLVYPSDDPVLDQPKKAESTEPDDISFEALHQPPELKEETKPNELRQPD